MVDELETQESLDLDATLALTKNEALREATTTTIAEMQEAIDDGTVEPEELESAILKASKMNFALHNDVADKLDKWRYPERLEAPQIAAAMNAIYTVCSINAAKNPVASEKNPIGVYMEDGPNKGIYVTDEIVLHQIASRFDYCMNSKKFKEVVCHLRDIVPVVEREYNQDLICVNNGIFDYKAKKLMPHSKEHVFLSKSHVDYDESAENPMIQMPDGEFWDVESWMAGLSDDPEIVNLLWEGLSALLRPMVPWNKSLWLYSQTGNNGKGTYCELARNIVGEGSYASIQLDQFSNEFMLEPLVHAGAIIVDENDVGIYIDRSANLKAVITNDVIAINRKFKEPIAYRFFGFMIQCLNEYPKIRDRSDSFYRRQLFVPMDKCFTGKTREYIKTDYLRRPEVLRYVLKKVLSGNFYRLSEPAAARSVLEDFRESNDPTLQFWLEVKDDLQWDLLPWTFLYDLYKEWYKRNVKDSAAISKSRFMTEIRTIATRGGQWVVLPKTTKIPVAGRMATAELLIDEYGLNKRWGSKSYSGADRERACTPDKTQLSHAYNGLLRATDDYVEKHKDIVKSL